LGDSPCVDMDGEEWEPSACLWERVLRDIVL
jgi:hypothetical protein